MIRMMTDEEVKAADARRTFLYTSRFLIDNLTAIMMDPSKGGTGLYEDAARAKDHSILDWIRTIGKVQIADVHES